MEIAFVATMRKPYETPPVNELIWYSKTVEVSISGKSVEVRSMGVKLQEFVPSSI